MKKLITILLTLCLVLSMAACGNTNSTGTPNGDTNGTGQESEGGNTDVQALNMESVYENILVKINAGEDIIMFSESNPEIIEEFYEGLSNIELKQQVYYIHPVTGFACEIMLVEVANEADVQTVVDIFEGRIALGANDEFYADTAALWKSNAKVQSYGNYVCMIALPEEYTIPESIFVQ